MCLIIFTMLGVLIYSSKNVKQCQATLVSFSFKYNEHVGDPVRFTFCNLTTIICLALPFFSPHIAKG